VDHLSAALTAISHPARRAIIDTLAQGPKRFTDVAEPFDLALNSITKHLKLLDRAGLIQREKQGREVLISLRPEPLRLVSDWVHEYERFWTERMDEFERHYRNKRNKQEKKK
jgi:DNA-binding transcriptional ArsR family regulator